MLVVAALLDQMEWGVPGQVVSISMILLVLVVEEEMVEAIQALVGSVRLVERVVIIIVMSVAAAEESGARPQVQVQMAGVEGVHLILVVETQLGQVVLV